MANKAQRACAALREAADALDAIPAACRLTSLFGFFNSAQNMRQEADHIEQLLGSFAALTDDAEPSSAPPAGLVSAAHLSVEHRSRMNHALCDDCWDAREPGSPSPRTGNGPEERCCGCGFATRSGIYVRARPEELTSCPAK